MPAPPAPLTAGFDKHARNGSINHEGVTAALCVRVVMPHAGCVKGARGSTEE